MTKRFLVSLTRFLTISLGKMTLLFAGKLRSLPKSGFDILGSKDETSEGPDLIVIHGGKRQLSAGTDLFCEF